jgi:ATP-dependent Lon protease
VRAGLAMTGEVSLAGRVLPVGGIKEKVLAAHRVGVRTLLLPKRNEKNLLEDVPAPVREALAVHLVDSVHDVIRLALEEAPTRPGPRVATVAS